MLKALLQGVLARSGFTIKRVRDPFQVQRALVKVRDPIVFDVGAHEGRVALEYRRLLPGGRIFCFEPFPQSYDRLRAAVAGDARISCHPWALSSSSGQAVLHVNAQSATNSLFATDPRGEEYWGKGKLETRAHQNVLTRTLDDVRDEFALERIDILKLDVQGSEYDVLLGASGALAEGAISLVFAELLICSTYERQHRLHEYLALLDGYGYHLVDCFNGVRRQAQLLQCDVLFAAPGVAD